MENDRAKDFSLVVIDVQEKFEPSIHEFDKMVGNITKLIRGMRLLEVPILVTEQYPEGLGRTVEDVACALGDFTPISKLSFSCMESVGFKTLFERLAKKEVVLCGIEAHVCLFNTAKDLLDQGYTVHFAADATSSRKPYDKEIALRRVESEGAKLTTAEMILFELMHKAGTDKFKKMLEIVR